MAEARVAARMTGSASPTSQGAAIELRDLSKRYGSFTAVDRISLEVPRGEVFALLGPNGAGKTTTIKMMSGLVTPTSGSARLGGFDIGRQRGQAVRQLGAVLEGSRNIYWSLSAWQNLLYFGRLKGLRGADIKPRAERLLRDLGLWERRGQQVGGFSRGMQQKVAVAAAYLLLFAALGVQLPLRPSVLLPAAITVLDIAGFALFIGGIALVVNSIGAIVHVIQSVIMFLNGAFIPIFAFPDRIETAAKFVPTTLGADAIRKLTTTDASLGQIWADGTLPWALLHAAVLLTLGWTVYQAAIRRGLREGRLGA